MTRLVILIPSGGMVHTRFMLSLIGLTQRLRQRGVAFALKTYEFSDLVVSRNYLVSYFLSQERLTHALLLDSDLEFPAEQFFRLLEFDQDFTAATYADRRVTARVLKDAVQAAQPEDYADGEAVRKLLSRHMQYIVTKDLGKGESFTLKEQGGFHTAASVGTGFMLIKRRVVEEIVANGQARPLPRMGKLPVYADAPRFADFFSHHLTHEEDCFYGEDQSFCRRWILGCGGDIWVDKNSTVTHIGSFSFHGDYAAQLGAVDE